MLINDITAQNITLFAAKPAHGLILHSPAGAGKRQVAAKLVEDAFPQAAVKTIRPDKGKAIGVEAIRSELNFLTVKSAGNTNRVLLIEQAELLTEEAQNTLLKTLEEPAPGSNIVLLCQSLAKLLPTIQSRAVQIEVLPLTKQQAKKAFQDAEPAVLERNFLLSEGRAALLESLMNGENHPLLDEIEQAKDFLKLSTFERLKKIDDLKDTSEQVVSALAKIAKSALRNPAISTSQRTRWIRVYEAAQSAADQLQAYVSKKTVLLNLILEMN